MKYRLTPGNGFFLFALGVWLYYKVNSGDPHNALGASYIFFFSILVLIGDFLFQVFITNYKKLVLIESISLVVVIAIGLLS